MLHCINRIAGAVLGKEHKEMNRTQPHVLDTNSARVRSRGRDKMAVAFIFHRKDGLGMTPWKQAERNSQCGLWGWRDGSVVKSTGCSSRDPEFNSQ